MSGELSTARLASLTVKTPKIIVKPV